MKKSKIFLLFILSAFISISCSKDDGGGDNGGSANVPDGVPTGEIVSEGERQFVLTGFNETSKGTSANLKRWEYDYGKVFSDNCPEYDQSLSGSYYIAFNPNNFEIEYTDAFGEVISAPRDWEWGSGKNSIILDGQELTFSVLNSNNVVWFSNQSGGGCSVVTFESLIDPITD